MAGVFILLCLAFVAIALVIEIISSLFEFSFGVAALLTGALCLIIALGLKVAGY